ncbi:DegT/DnrJ/EryC1/StrS family aminotransferase [Verrucomicrobia bacterium]|nr:DegT/DnrJ/EryC1/StrS family aminotransferase [Verrucomicrobiota bacterium]
MLAYGKQCIGKDDIAAVVAALKSDYLTTGPEVEAFEQEFAEMIGAKHAVAVNNATAALHLAMLVAGIGQGERVVTSPNTFLSSANCAAFVGATPDFADIDPATYNLCPQQLEANWKDDTKAVIAVAYAGLPCDMPAIAEIARKRGAIVIEDGCHGPGGGFIHDGKFYKIGAHPWADITTFSFHPVKTMTTGEGGMLVTDNDAYAARARLLRSHGITRDSDTFGVFKEQGTGARKQEAGNVSQKNSAPCSPLFRRGPWTYEMQILGYNYRITDIQCALGRSQLKKLSDFILRRQEIFDQYNSAFQDLEWLDTPKDGGWCVLDSDKNDLSKAIFYSPSETTDAMRPIVSQHLYTVQIDFEALGKSRNEVMAKLRDQGIGTQVLYIPVYLQPWYQQNYGYGEGKCPNAEAYYLKSLSLPLYSAMMDADVEHVIKVVRQTAHSGC